MSLQSTKGFRYPQLQDTANVPRDLQYLALDIDAYLTTNTGAAGTQGVSGLQGTQGIQGISGAFAGQGIQGRQGTTGIQGFQGVQGISGAFAGQGIQGTAGPQGLQGIGTQGVQGISGAFAGQGVQGRQGTQGFSEKENSATQVLYVSKSGSDSNNGTTIARAFLTIKAALAIATDGTTVIVKSGDYTEANPVTIPTGVSVVGDSLRSVTIRPANTSSHIFYVNNGVYITEVTFKGHTNGAAAVAYNPDGSAGVITRSPYVYNASSISTGGKGMYIDGSKASGNKSMVAGQYTQINYGGIGVHIVNQGYAQLVGIYTIFTDVGILCESGGFCSLIGSDTSFGNYGLKAVGVSSILNSGTVFSNDTINQSMVISGLTTTPYANNVVTFDNGTTWYTLNSVTPVVGGKSTITLTTNIPTNLVNGTTTAKFYQNSRITASGHTFEYCGSGIDPATALPQLGGIPVPESEVVMSGGGAVFFTSTDQKGNFKIGPDLVIDQSSGTISGTAFNRSLFSIMTPYMLALEG